ncbi:MAG: ribonuclease P protein component [Phycisphaerales bacterium]|jgi:ribonuclease P protein component|nr:ribonuclease P protein component [Phycisphaerales bacterium]
MPDEPTSTRPPDGERRTLRARHRLSKDLDYKAAFGARLRKSRGGITIFARATALAEHRLGLSVGRAYGGAVERNRMKRLIREAFRLERHELPRHAGGAYDVVVSARRHEAQRLDWYRRTLRELVEQAHAEHERRASRRPGGRPSDREGADREGAE